MSRRNDAVLTFLARRSLITPMIADLVNVDPFAILELVSESDRDLLNGGAFLSQAAVQSYAKRLKWDVERTRIAMSDFYSWRDMVALSSVRVIELTDGTTVVVRGDEFVG